jgi:hypothetical protein
MEKVNEKCSLTTIVPGKIRRPVSDVSISTSHALRMMRNLSDRRA